MNERPDEGTTDAGQLADRARELAARARQLADRAAGVAESEEELASLERELADLDGEERKLDAEFAQLLGGAPSDDSGGERGPTFEERVSGWGERLAEYMETLGDRITDAMAGAFGTRPGSGSWQHAVREVAVDAPLPVRVESDAGSVVVRVGETGRVRAEAERRGFGPWRAGEGGGIDLEVQRDDEGVRVSCHAPRDLGHLGVSLDVTVPMTSPVSIETRGGPIRVERVGGPVTAETKGGSIRVEGGVGHADLQTVGGSITASHHAGSVHARTGGGSVKLGGHLTDDVVAETVGGSVRLEGVRATVRARAMGGSVYAGGRFQGDSRLETAGGSVSVAVTADCDVRVDASGYAASTDVAGLHAARGSITGTVGDGSEGTLVLRARGGAVRVSGL